MIERFALLWSVVSQEVRKCWIDRRERSSGTVCSKGNPREDRNRWLFQIRSNSVDYPEIVWKQYSRTKLTNYPHSGNTFHICCHHRSTRPNRCRIANGLGLETKLLEDHLKYFPTNFYIWILENRGWGWGVITLPYSVLNLTPWSKTHSTNRKRQNVIGVNSPRIAFASLLTHLVFKKRQHIENI